MKIEPEMKKGCTILDPLCLATLIISRTQNRKVLKKATKIIVSEQIVINIMGADENLAHSLEVFVFVFVFVFVS